jgi:hypothetical protein
MLDEGTVPLTVVTPEAGGGTSSPLTVTVQEALLPDGTQGTPNQRFVSEVYHDLLGRAVESAGLAGWSTLLDQGMARQQLVLAIDASAEYRVRVVQGLYSTLLHRDADGGGLSGFTNFLANGGTVEQLESIMAGSPEYFQVRGGGTNSGFVNALYKDFLNRSVDLFGWNTFNNLLLNGGKPSQVATIVLGSAEYRQDLVQGFYQRYLERAADAFGLNAWAALLGQGTRDENVIANLVGSLEFFNKTAS